MALTPAIERRYSISLRVPLINAQLCTPVATTVSTTSQCPKCGTIAKSGKASCCGVGGTWFKNCGSPGNSKFDHAWSEGIRACRNRGQSKETVTVSVTATDAKASTVTFTSTQTTPKPWITAVNAHAGIMETGVRTDWVAKGASCTRFEYDIYILSMCNTFIQFFTHTHHDPHCMNPAQM